MLVVVLCAQAVAQEAPLAVARAAAKSGRAGVALGAFELHLRSHPDDRPVLREAAAFAVGERRFFEAAALLERLTALDPSDPGPLFDLGATRFTQARYDLAITAFSQLEALEATVPRVAAMAEHHYYRGEAARLSKSYGDAIDHLRMAVARAPGRVEFAESLAQALFDGGRFDEAASTFESLTKTQPTAAHWYGLGIALAEKGDADAAERALREARRLDRGDGRVLLKLGLVELRRKDLDLAETFLREAQPLAPRNHEITFGLAQIARLKGRVEEAAQLRSAAEAARAEADAATENARKLNRRVALEPSNVAALFEQGVDFLQNGEFAQAERVFSRLLSFDPGHELAILNLAALETRDGRAANALKDLQRLLDLDPGNPLANLSAARVRIAGRDVQGARRNLDAALARREGDPEAHRLLSICLHAMGERAAAERHAARAREIETATKGVSPDSAPTSRPKGSA